MSDRERLNSILRLRLFCSTERELSEIVGYQLHGNHFSHFKDFQCEAYFSMFEKTSRGYVNGSTSLGKLLEQYKATSEFYKEHIARKPYVRSKTFILPLLDSYFLGKTDADTVVHVRDLALCKSYDDYDREHQLNIGILILLTYGLIPSYTNKAAQDVTDIIADFQTAYDILVELARAKAEKSTAKFDELLCLQEMRQMIKNEREGNKNLNRLLLIHVVCDTLCRIYAFVRPDLLHTYAHEQEPMDFGLARLWRCEEEAANVVWEFEKAANIPLYSLYRKEIDFDQRQVHVTEYLVGFLDVGCEGFCQAVIMQPSYVYNNILHREQEERAVTSDYPDIKYDADGHTVTELAFDVNSPLGAKPLTLRPVEREEEIRYYEARIDHKGVGRDFVDVNDYPEYAVKMYTLEVAVADGFLLFKFGGECYRMDKYDADGNETVDGISALTHSDNYVFAELMDGGTPRYFLCLDHINQNLDLDILLEQPYFRKVEAVKDIFG